MLSPTQIGLTDEPLAASFVRPTRPADKPRTFPEALRFKYAGSYVEATDGSKAIIISGKKVEEVGFEKIRELQSHLHELRIVYVDGLLISQPMNPHRAHEIANICPKVTTLDLSRNLLESIEEVAYICEFLSRLRELRLK